MSMILRVILTVALLIVAAVSVVVLRSRKG